MTGIPAPGPDSPAHSAMLLQDGRIEDQAVLADLYSDPQVEVIDHRTSLLAQWNHILPQPTSLERTEPFRWAYYPWRRTLVAVLGPIAFHRLRLDRNRNKITAAEQRELGRLTIGVVGLSAGHAIAHTLAMEGLCRQLRLADFDSVELSNLNRMPATVFDLGINKAIVTARRIAEIDPYMRGSDISGRPDRTKPSALFSDGVDLVIEECDSLDVKVGVRAAARSRRIPVLMQTSDRGLFDVERFDREPDRELFHGLLGDGLDPQALRNLTTHDKAPHVMRILEAPALSARMAASMVEIDQSVSTWPQLAGDVQLGAATVAAAVRRYGCGENLPSGRIRIDLDSAFDELDPAVPTAATLLADDGRAADLTRQIPQRAVDAVIHAIRLAPSGGNSQPWSISATPSSVDIHLTTVGTSAMDVGLRGSYVAIGAGGLQCAGRRRQTFGARHCRGVPDGPASDVIVSITLGHGTDASLSSQYPAMIERISNRTIGRRAPLSTRLAAELQDAAEAEGALLHLVTDLDQLRLLADVLAESDRLRYLTPLLHGQMISELKWPGLDSLDTGIDVRTLGVDAGELAKLQVASRFDVIAYLAAWGVGHALGDGTRERITSSSAVAVIAIDRDTAPDYLRGGAAAERVWIRACRDGLGVQPVSPVFLYARTQGDLCGLSARFTAELTELQHRFNRIVGLGVRQAPALVIRISHDPGSVVRSRRLPRASILSTGAFSGPTAGRHRAGPTVLGASTDSVAADQQSNAVNVRRQIRSPRPDTVWRRGIPAPGCIPEPTASSLPLRFRLLLQPVAVRRRRPG